ncbi:MAG: competence protein ComEC family protein [Armatimonadetes bacterium]|nr:competence protein ComEC family protein [Armatimonadota bacterium]MDW8029308.1 ComEC/Rec2 family competence protein [Armatimonadota bacterium]
MDTDWLVKRPLAVVSAAFVAGALAEAGLPEENFVLVAAFVLLVFSLLLAFAFSQYLLFWASIGVFALGLWLTRYRLPSIPTELHAPFEGIIASAPILTKDGYRLLLSVNEGFAQVSVRSDDLPKWQIGDWVRVEDFRGRTTTWRRMRFQKVFWVGRTEHDALLRLGNRSDAFYWQKWREKWRQFVFERWQQSLLMRERTSTIAALASIVFGMRTVAISEADEIAFARSGLAHLFVPSGSQVTLLMGLAWLANRTFNLPPFPILLLMLSFYLPLTRGEPSIFRAVLMGLYAFAGWRWFRDVDWQTSLWLSSALLVAIEPAMLHDVGFQLSYAATFGLIYAAPLLMRWLNWLPEWLSFPLAATLSAQLFLTPVLMHYFGRISIIAPVANLCAVVPASFALTLGFLSALISLTSPLLAMPISVVAGELAKLVVQMAHGFASPSWASIYTSQISGAQTLIALAFLTAIVAWLKRVD